MPRLPWLDQARARAEQEHEAAHIALVDERVIVVRHSDLAATRLVGAVCGARGVPDYQRFAAMEATRWLTATAATPPLSLTTELAPVPDGAGDPWGRAALEDSVYVDAWRLCLLVRRACLPWYRRVWPRPRQDWYSPIVTIIADVLARRAGDGCKGISRISSQTG